MRLTCPNCDAQYEVPDDVVPPEGRDVQCSACGKTWFQPAAGAPEHEDFDPARQSARPGPEDASAAAPEPAPSTPPQPAAPQRQLDPEVASVLREEAERESRVREAERGAVESQPDLGLDDMRRTEDEQAQRARQSRERMARLRGKDPKAPEPTPSATAAAAAAASGASSISSSLSRAASSSASSTLRMARQLIGGVLSSRLCSASATSGGNR